jgi:hypothetical protein
MGVAKCCEMFCDSKVILSGRRMILEIKDKPSEGKFIFGGAFYLQDDRKVSQTDSAVLTSISQSTRPSNKEGIWRSEGTSKALSIRNRVRNEGEETVSQIC